MSDDEKQQDGSVQLMEAILKKLDCLDVLDARLTELDRQQHLHSAYLQRLEQRHEHAPPDPRRDGPMGQARFHKLDFPNYDGIGDPMPFVNKCEHYFRGQRTIEEEKVWLAALNLHDAAQQCYTQVEKDEGTPSWNRFKELLDLRFGPPLRSNPLGELVACRLTSTVADFQDCFQELLARAGPLQENQKAQLFLAGLGEPLSLDVQIQGPQSLAMAMSLARSFERRNAAVAAAHQPQAPPPALASATATAASARAASGPYIYGDTSNTAAQAPGAVLVQRNHSGGRSHRPPPDPTGDRRTSPSRPLLQLRRTICSRPQPFVQEALPPRRRLRRR